MGIIKPFKFLMNHCWHEHCLYGASALGARFIKSRLPQLVNFAVSYHIHASFEELHQSKIDAVMFNLQGSNQGLKYSPIPIF